MDPRLRILTSFVCEKISKQEEYSKAIGIKECSVMKSVRVDEKMRRVNHTNTSVNGKIYF